MTESTPRNFTPEQQVWETYRLELLRVINSAIDSMPANTQLQINNKAKMASFFGPFQDSIRDKLTDEMVLMLKSIKESQDEGTGLELIIKAYNTKNKKSKKSLKPKEQSPEQNYKDELVKLFEKLYPEAPNSNFGQLTSGEDPTIGSGTGKFEIGFNPLWFSNFLELMTELGYYNSNTKQFIPEVATYRGIDNSDTMRIVSTGIVELCYHNTIICDSFHKGYSTVLLNIDQLINHLKTNKNIPEPTIQDIVNWVYPLTPGLTDIELTNNPQLGTKLKHTKTWYAKTIGIINSFAENTEIVNEIKPTRIKRTSKEMENWFIDFIDNLKKDNLPNRTKFGEINNILDGRSNYLSEIKYEGKNTKYKGRNINSIIKGLYQNKSREEMKIANIAKFTKIIDNYIPGTNTSSKKYPKLNAYFNENHTAYKYFDTERYNSDNPEKIYYIGRTIGSILKEMFNYKGNQKIIENTVRNVTKFIEDYLIDSKTPFNQIVNHFLYNNNYQVLNNKRYKGDYKPYIDKNLGDILILIKEKKRK